VLRYSPPTVTKVATPGKDSIVKGEAFEIEGTNLRYDAGDTVKAKWNAGGTAGEQLLAPTAVTPTKMSFAAASGFDALPDNAALAFEVTVSGTTDTKTTTLLPAPGPSFASAKSEGEADGTVKPDTTVVVTGTSMRAPTSDEGFELSDNMGRHEAPTFVSVSPDGTTLTLALGACGEFPEGCACTLAMMDGLTGRPIAQCNVQLVK